MTSKEFATKAKAWNGKDTRLKSLTAKMVSKDLAGNETNGRA